ncbi:spore coat protein [Virgibacillus sediminis]|uniref:Spore coat protein n=1 Tax=Virgibacillus sediminis TaxID=202260 RepID=A0ABV7AA11_9BACI
MEGNQLSKKDQTIVTDMLFESKAGIKDIATAISETTSSDIRSLLREELRTAIQHQEQIYSFMQEHGLYDSYDISKQIEKDVRNADMAINQTGGE